MFKVIFLRSDRFNFSMKAPIDNLPIVGRPCLSKYCGLNDWHLKQRSCLLKNNTQIILKIRMQAYFSSKLSADFHRQRPPRLVSPF